MRQFVTTNSRAALFISCQSAEEVLGAPDLTSYQVKNDADRLS